MEALQLDCNLPKIKKTKLWPISKISEIGFQPVSYTLAERMFRRTLNLIPIIVAVKVDDHLHHQIVVASRWWYYCTFLRKRCPFRSPNRNFFYDPTILISVESIIITHHVRVRVFDKLAITLFVCGRVIQDRWSTMPCWSLRDPKYIPKRKCLIRYRPTGIYAHTSLIGKQNNVTKFLSWESEIYWQLSSVSYFNWTTPWI